MFLDTYRCVKGQGMVNMRTHEAGDLIVLFDVEFPPEKFFTDPQVLEVRQPSINYKTVYRQSFI